MITLLCPTLCRVLQVSALPYSIGIVFPFPFLSFPLPTLFLFDMIKNYHVTKNRNKLRESVLLCDALQCRAMQCIALFCRVLAYSVILCTHLISSAGRGIALSCTAMVLPFTCSFKTVFQVFTAFLLLFLTIFTYSPVCASLGLSDTI